MPAKVIGLLEAETLPPHIADRFGSYGDMFAELLRPLGLDLQFRYYAADQGQLPLHWTECDAYIVTGSRHSAYDKHPWIDDLKAFIRRLHREERKCLGICFGHQVIAQALGGKVSKSEKGWGIGLARFAIHDRPQWMTDAQAFNILVSHQDQVDQLPPSARLFATSDFCSIGGYWIGEHIFCLQGHPEFSKDYVRFLIDKRRERIGLDRAAEAERSLEQSVPVEILRGWIKDFFCA